MKEITIIRFSIVVTVQLMCPFPSFNEDFNIYFSFYAFNAIISVVALRE